MRKKILVTGAVSVVVLLTAAFMVMSWGLKTIEAGPVRLAGPGRSTEILGLFRVNGFSPGDKEDYIFSTGSGGACLIADLNVINIPAPGGLRAGGGARCTSNEQCDALGKANWPQYFNTGDLAKNWHSYCVSERCWTRPGTQPEYCNAGPDKPVRNDGEWNSAPASSTGTVSLGGVRALPGGADKRFAWRVYACLNGMSGLNSNKACGTGVGEKLTDADGPTLTTR